MSDISPDEVRKIIMHLDATIKNMMLQRDALAGLLPKERRANKGSLVMPPLEKIIGRKL